MQLFTDAEIHRAEAIILHAIREFFVECEVCAVSELEWHDLDEKIEKLEQEYLANPELVAEMVADAGTFW